ncbi:Ureidoglycolate lyase [Maioricimonas rarisocia]|uniref:Ureidoglycolate lyase n=1 Tax=Maioricimonas rarisocia TaxID=2528026 RepID=A0A517Z4D0_9PLAN|nr:fumarylacetoacetate hydrolase family protein [Maioricimonas rarisocia]QDU37342.1 Ureidoglycolate lyase [Maioricimonas rarisocia]
MKLATLATTDGPRVVAVDTSAAEARYVDLAAVDASLPTSLRGLLATDGGVDRAAAAAEKGLAEGTFVEGDPQAPIPDPGKVICIGLNYRDHAEESGMAIPDEPVCFSKFGNTIVGPGDAIRLPAVSQQVDYEAELVIVIGKRAYGVSQENAFEYVAGYMNGHDVSARDWQIGKPGKQWLLGKTPDTFAPIGPWLVTRDEVADPHALDISLRLNGETMQSGNTREFIFGVDELIAYLTQIMTLEPGDIIFTGTPPGVGMARDPQVFLKPGDDVEVEIAGLGVLANPVVAG